MRKLLVGAAAVLLLFCLGCGVQRSRVYGTVRYNGRPLTGATVIFLAHDNQAYPVDVKTDGFYERSGVPRGPVRVAVQVAEPRPKPRPDPNPEDLGPKVGDNFARAAAKADDAGKLARLQEAPPAPPPGPRIPPHYSDPNRSGLSFELKEPDQEYNIDLKSS